jgi:hypothetical protein
MRRGQNNVSCGPVGMGTEPVSGGHSPPIAGHQFWKPVLRHRRGQVVADGPLVLGKLCGDHGADRVAPVVLRSCRTTPVTVEARGGIGATWLQCPTHDVSIDHGPIIVDEPDQAGNIDRQRVTSLRRPDATDTPCTGFEQNVGVGGPTRQKCNLALEARPEPVLIGLGDPKRQICYQALAA